MDKELEIINFNDVVQETSSDEVLKFKQNNELLPQHPFRAIIFGSSGSGKSNLLLNLITKSLNFTKLYIFAKDLTEDKYNFLIKHFVEIEKETGTQILFMANSIDGIPHINDIDKDEQNLIVFDDFITNKNQDIIQEYYVRGRKRNSSIIYIGQVFHKIPKVVRDNCDYFMLFSTPSARELNGIGQTLATDIDIKTFLKVYRKCMEKPFNFMMIDRKTTNKRLKYRGGLNGIIENLF